MSRSPAEELRRLIFEGTVVAPTAYDMVAARIMEQAGFAAVFCSGYGQSASALGLPDRGLMTLDILEARVAAMTRAVSIPVLVDADTGFGDPRETVDRLSAAGAAAIMLEDQVPQYKRCGHLSGKKVVAAEQMEKVLRSAVGSPRRDSLIIARTDAREPLGLQEAVERGRRYAEAGADVVFIEAPQSVDELAAIPPALTRPAMANMVPDGRTPSAGVGDLARMGFRLIVFGLLDLMVAAAALRRAFSELKHGGRLESVTVPRLRFDELNELTGLTRPLEAMPPR